jgi:hypothetical protein
LARLLRIRLRWLRRVRLRWLLRIRLRWLLRIRLLLRVLLLRVLLLRVLLLRVRLLRVRLRRVRLLRVLLLLVRLLRVRLLRVRLLRVRLCRLLGDRGLGEQETSRRGKANPNQHRFLLGESWMETSNYKVGGATGQKKPSPRRKVIRETRFGEAEWLALVAETRIRLSTMAPGVR